MVVDFYLVCGIASRRIKFVLFSGDKNVGYSTETGVFKSLVPKAFTCKEPAHILVAFDSACVAALIIGRENVVQLDNEQCYTLFAG